MKLKKGNTKKLASWARISLLPSMIVSSILGVTSSSFDYYLADTGQTSSFTAYVLPVYTNITVYGTPSFFQCPEAPSANLPECLKLSNDVELTVENENDMWLKIIDCKGSTPVSSSNCSKTKGQYIHKSSVLTDNKDAYLSFKRYQQDVKYRDWINSEVNDWLNAIKKIKNIKRSPEQSPQESKLIDIVNNKLTIQDLTVLTKLTDENELDANKLAILFQNLERELLPLSLRFNFKITLSDYFSELKNMPPEFLEIIKNSSFEYLNALFNGRALQLASFVESSTNNIQEDLSKRVQQLQPLAKVLILKLKEVTTQVKEEKASIRNQKPLFHKK
ncbi:hypothetical protein ACEYW6_24245 [Nostoc sp. UIC 10607]|uniref:hypothetical protein n=1 Tax=Nostoc sp. UIC 10607 TaxID=3045935 RepID=UPI0039A28A7A